MFTTRTQLNVLRFTDGNFLNADNFVLVASCLNEFCTTIYVFKRIIKQLLHKLRMVSRIIHADLDIVIHLGFT